MSRRHVVSEGDCLASIAHRYGVGDARVLFDHPDNAALERRREDPALLVPGDVVVVPDVTTKEVSVATGRRHEFVLQEKSAPVFLSVRVEDDEGRPYRDCPFVLSVDEAEWVEGRSDGDGWVEHEIPPNARAAELMLLTEDGAVPLPFELLFGGMGPIEERRYAVERLRNLGYFEEGESLKELAADLESEDFDDDGTDPTAPQEVTDAMLDAFVGALSSDAASVSDIFDEDDTPFDGWTSTHEIKDDDPSSVDPADAQAPDEDDPEALLGGDHDPVAWAVIAFQLDHDIRPTGELDAPTSARLSARYDG